MKKILFLVLIIYSGVLYSQEQSEYERWTELKVSRILQADFISELTNRIQDSVYLNEKLITPDLLKDVPVGIEEEDYLSELNKWVENYDKWSFLTQINISKLKQCDTVYFDSQRDGRKRRTQSKYLFQEGVLSFKCDDEYMLYDISFIKVRNQFYMHTIFRNHPNVKIKINYD